VSWDIKGGIRATNSFLFWGKFDHLRRLFWNLIFFLLRLALESFCPSSHVVVGTLMLNNAVNLGAELCPPTLEKLGKILDNLTPLFYPALHTPHLQTHKYGIA
jgi:hypothetical protein